MQERQHCRERDAWVMAACSCGRLWRNRTAERVPGQGQREAAPGLCGAACRGEVGDGREFVLMFQNFSNANSQLLWVLIVFSKFRN